MKVAWASKEQPLFELSTDVGELIRKMQMKR